MLDEEQQEDDLDFIAEAKPKKSKPKKASKAEGEGQAETEEEDEDGGGMGADDEETGPDPELVAARFAELKKLYLEAAKIKKDKGAKDKKALKAQQAMSEYFATFKLASIEFNRLTGRLRQTLELIRTQERTITRLCVDKAKLPRKTFVTTFQGHETDLNWITQFEGKDFYKALLGHKDNILEAQKRIIQAARDYGLSVDEIKEI